MSIDHHVLILGGGLAGLAAASFCDQDYLLLEGRQRLGGLARTERVGGYNLDYTGHWLHLRDPRIQTWIGELMGEQLISIERQARCFSSGRFTHYPFQANTHGLPEQIAFECLSGFIHAREQRRLHPREPEHFLDWIHYQYGPGIAKHFMVPYNRKLWGLDLDQITAAWTDRFVPKPDLDTVLRGALGMSRQQLGYNAHFLYPVSGGIEELPKAIATHLDATRLRTGSQVTSIHPGKRKLCLANGSTFGYEHLISSIPLPRLVECLEQAPEEVRRAAAKLRYTSVTFTYYGIRGQAPFPYHWVYYPEAELPFYRLGCASNVVSSTAPEGRYLLYLERSGTHGAAIARADLIAGLKRVGWLKDEADIDMERDNLIECAYVIFDRNYEEAREVIFKFLEQKRIYPVGRFGRWTYGGMEDALLDGIHAVENLK